MKKILLNILVLALSITSLFAQNILNSNRQDNQSAKISQTPQGINISQSFDYLSINSVRLNSTEFLSLYMGEGFNNSTSLGKANLPRYNILVSIPLCKDFQIEEQVLQTQRVDLKKDYLIEPVQASRSKQNEDIPFSFDEKYYNQNDFDKEPLAKIEVLGIMGGQRLARISINPVKYNPLSNTIEVARQINVNIKYIGIDDKANEKMKSHSNAAMRDYLQTKLAGSTVDAQPRTKPYTLVVLAPDMFQATLQPYIAWKKQEGFKVIEAYTSATGTDTLQIRNYLKNIYNSEDSFDYLLICGDTPQVPAYKGKFAGNYETHYTDLYYAEYTNDMLPDVFYGRMSARDVQTLEAILNKTITYEKYLFNDDAFLDRTLLVAGVESSSPAPTVTNGHVNYAKQYIVANAPDTSVYYNPNSGNQQNAVLSKINLGQSWVNYTAHCSQDGWYKPAFLSSNINSISNEGMFGVFINNCCQAGMYDQTECFSEKILRAPNKGAVASIAASNYTYWYEDYYWAVGNKPETTTPSYDANNLGVYDRLMHTHQETKDKHYITAGQIMIAGNLAVTQSGSILTNYYWEVYNLMGDPSLMPYIGKGHPIEAQHQGIAVLGMDTYIIETEPYAYAAISLNGDLVDAKQADINGHITLDLSSITEPAILDMVITSQFAKPLIDSLVVIPNNEAFICISDITITPENSQAQDNNVWTGERFNVNLKLKNVGQQDYIGSEHNVFYQSLNNQYINDVSENFTTLSFLAAGQDTAINNAFSFSVVEAIEESYPIKFLIQVDEFQKNTTFKSIAPKTQIEDLVITRNNDTYHITFALTNKGSKTAAQGIWYAENYTQPEEVAPLEIGDKITKSLQVSVPQNQDSLHLVLRYIAEPYGVANICDISLNNALEGFETKNFLNLDWISEGSNAWVIDSTTAYEGLASARSKKNLGNDSESRLTLSVNVLNNDTISFYYKTSTEASYDLFNFLIDGQTLLTKSGENSWRLAKYPISSGIHTLTWIYSKDYSESSGQDAVWIDNVKIPITGNIQVVNYLQDTEEVNVKIYPNPATDYITLQNINNFNSILIYDLSGRLVYYADIESNEQQVNTHRFGSGVYNLILQGSNKNQTHKIIIK